MRSFILIIPLWSTLDRGSNRPKVSFWLIGLTPSRNTSQILCPTFSSRMHPHLCHLQWLPSHFKTGWAVTCWEQKRTPSKLYSSTPSKFLPTCFEEVADVLIALLEKSVIRILSQWPPASLSSCTAMITHSQQWCWRKNWVTALPVLLAHFLFRWASKKRIGGRVKWQVNGGRWQAGKKGVGCSTPFHCLCQRLELRPSHSSWWNTAISFSAKKS